MTFEKALEAMKQGKKVRRKAWTDYPNSYVEEISGYTHFYCDNMPLESMDSIVNAMEADWEIYEPEKKVEPDAFKNLRCDINPMSYDEWKEAHIDAREYKKRIAELEAENAELNNRLANGSGYMCMTACGLVCGKSESETINKLVDRIGELERKNSKNQQVITSIRNMMLKAEE